MDFRTADTSVRSRRLSGAIAWTEGLASRRLGAILVFVAGLLAYAMRAQAWPLRPGRDLDEYLYSYDQLFDRHVLLPWSLLFRTPVTPLVAGPLLDVWQGRLAEPAMAVLYAGSILCWAAAARWFGPWVAVAVAASLLLYQGYALMFHELSSEPVFAAAFAVWALLVVRACLEPSARRFAAAGGGVAVIALVRPGNAVLLAFGIVPLLVAGSWRAKLSRTGAFALAALVPLLAWSAHNGLRFDSWGLARGGNAILPFYRAFITDHIISPSNGESSRELAAAMQGHLLTRQPYAGYGVTLDELFSRGSFRVHEDLYILSDKVFGWDTDYSILRKAGLEGVRAHPGTYARGVSSTVWDQLSKAEFRAVSAPAPSGSSSASTPPTVVIHGERLPAPTEGEPIPSGQVVWISRPDQSIRQVWTSPTQWHFEFEHPAQRARFQRIERDVNGLFAALPDRAGNPALGLRLNQLSRWYPRPWMWIVLAVVAIAWRRPRGWPVLVALGLAAFAVVFLNALGLFADLHFLLPVAPAFVLLGLGGLLGVRPDAPTRPG